MQRAITTVSVLVISLVFITLPAVAATINVNYSLSNGESMSFELDGAAKNTTGLEFSPVNLDFDVDGSYDLSTIAYCVELTQSVGNNNTYS
ncbi:MAG: hypothetical protein GY927_22460, partial [bacterium]|nr:hypothetical protein [bacterium]